MLSESDVEEARRLLYVGMTRTKERLVLTRVVTRNGKPTGGHQLLDEMGLVASTGPMRTTPVTRAWVESTHVMG